jgi:hypothetical protein
MIPFASTGSDDVFYGQKAPLSEKEGKSVDHDFMLGDGFAVEMLLLDSGETKLGWYGEHW